MKHHYPLGFLLCLLFCLSAHSKTVYEWYNPYDAGYPVMNGIAFPAECWGNYQRIGNIHKDSLPDYVWENAVNSAGISLRFYSHSPKIRVRYTCAQHEDYSLKHMPATGVSGLDLYATDSLGRQRICMRGYEFGDTVVYTFGDISYHDCYAFGYEFELFLPLYNTVTWMEIGVPQGETLRFKEADTRRPIVVYGTSIAHGGCASRPAMAWPAIVKRTLDVPMINWGFSGAGRLDPEMFDLMARVDASLYIIDCLPNVVHTPEDKLYQLFADGVHILRAKTDAPILIVEHDGYTCEYRHDGLFKEYDEMNVFTRRIFDRLVGEGEKNLYYLSHEEINMDPEGMVDCVHSTDLGMTSYARAYVKKIQEIFPDNKKHSKQCKLSRKK